MTPGDELTIHRIDSRDNWRGEVVTITDETVSARLGNGEMLAFRLSDGEETNGGKWRLAPKHLGRKR
jgi:hypothetical protein